MAQTNVIMHNIKPQKFCARCCDTHGMQQ